MGLPYTARSIANGESVFATSEEFFCTEFGAEANATHSMHTSSRYPSGAMIFAEQEHARGAFILLKGRVKLTMSSSEGRSAILRIADRGEVLGLEAIVSGRPYQATAETLEPCEVTFVPREEFLRVLRQNPEASLHAAQQLSSTYQTACEQVRSIGLAPSATGRLAGFLLSCATKGRAGDHSTRVLMTLTHEEIGQMIGLSRETVTRTMGALRRRHLVDAHGATLVIQDSQALRDLAGAA
jgi:CRP/FNR family transcriptional regulator, cyclic AMP receptor protein